MKRTRRIFKADFKAKVALEAIKQERTIAEIAHHYQLHPNLIATWKREFLANASRAFVSAEEESSEIRKLKEEKEQLIQQIGQLTVDNNWLKKKLL